MICKSNELYDHVCLCMQQCGDTSARIESGGPTAERLHMARAACCARCCCC